MRRRAFIALLGGAAAAWPLAARAQQPAMPVIGSLTGHSRISFAAYLSAFQRGLADIGFIEGRNLAIEYRFAEGRYDRMPEMAADLVRRPVSAMLVPRGGPQPVLISRVLTTIPVVFVTGADPVRGGIVQSLNRPGGNVTGIYQFAAAMDADAARNRAECPRHRSAGEPGLCGGRNAIERGGASRQYAWARAARPASQHGGRDRCSLRGHRRDASRGATGLRRSFLQQQA